MEIKIDASKAIQVLKEKSGDIKDGFIPSLTKVGLFLQGEVKDSIAGRRDEPTSVDTGRFLNSVNFSVGPDSVVVYSDVEYGKYLEFGTSKILFPRKHFTNTVFRNKPVVKEIVGHQVEVDVAT